MSKAIDDIFIVDTKVKYFEKIQISFSKHQMITGIDFLDDANHPTDAKEGLEAQGDGVIVLERFKNYPDIVRQCIKELKEYFEGQRKIFTVQQYFDYDKTVPTSFQKSVWSYLLNMVPYGTTQSYSDVSRGIGHKKAFRAVGAANGRNPFPIIIPCHRIINKDGSLGGYSSGIERKQALLHFEKQQPTNSNTHLTC